MKISEKAVLSVMNGSSINLCHITKKVKDGQQT